MINVTPDVLNRHADHLRYVYDNDGSADVMSAAAERIAKLEADMDQITGLLAGMGTFYTRSEVLERIDLLPSVQAAWDRNLKETP